METIILTFSPYNKQMETKAAKPTKRKATK